MGAKEGVCISGQTCSRPSMFSGFSDRLISRTCGASAASRALAVLASDAVTHRPDRFMRPEDATSRSDIPASRARSATLSPSSS
jgi:hypothetical protein